MHLKESFDRRSTPRHGHAVSSIYGPVNSWRLGRSLGVDLLLIDSICSFDCVYCQLGRIRKLTKERGVFVPTERVMADLKRSDWRSADVVTLSGSGEPTLAANLGEVIHAVKDFTGLPVVVLTNSTMLSDPQVRIELAGADRVECKLDAWHNDALRRINRPINNIDIDVLIRGIAEFRREYVNTLTIQTMVLSAPDRADIERFAKVLRQINPDEVHFNLPLRPVPGDWDINNRGNRYIGDERSHKLKAVDQAELLMFADAIESLTNIPVITPSITRAH